MPLHAQKKGKAGEEEMCKWLLKNLSIDVARNMKQSRGKGSDVVLEDFLIEVKRREILSLDVWWHQVVIAQKTYEKAEGLIPIVAYRQNRKPWMFLMPAKLIHGCELGYVIATEKVFIQFARSLING